MVEDIGLELQKTGKVIYLVCGRVYENIISQFIINFSHFYIFYSIPLNLIGIIITISRSKQNLKCIIVLVGEEYDKEEAWMSH